MAGREDVRVLAIDVGSSTIKAGVLRDGRLIGRPSSVATPVCYAGDRAEMDAERLWRAVIAAVRGVRQGGRSVDCISHCCLLPAVVGLDRRGAAVTAIITHQDRRSVEQARWIERWVGSRRYLAIAGNRPFPGGMSCTSMLWLKQHAPGVFGRVRTFGHVNTFLVERLTGRRVIDPANASFTGLYETTRLGGWSAELCEAVGIGPEMLPEIRQADECAGRVGRSGAAALGVAAGVPVLVGTADTSAAIIAAGARVGQLVHAVGTTDVLAVVTERARPGWRLLTRALGVGGKWVAVSTVAAGAGSLAWVHREFFADFSERRFYALVDRLVRRPRPTTVRFEPYLAGDRMSIVQRWGCIAGLRLASTRVEILQAAINALGAETAEGLGRLRRVCELGRQVVVVGGAGSLARATHVLWPGRWRFRRLPDATLRGLAMLAEQADL